MKLRRFQISDTPSIVKVYRDAVRHIGPRHNYSPEQVSAWSSFPSDPTDFGMRLTQGYTLVAEEDSRIYAFGQIAPLDCFAFLYTSSHAHKKGLGACLYDALDAHAHAEGVVEMHTEVSRIALPFFEKRGFKIHEVVQIPLLGVDFEWYRMKRSREATLAIRQSIKHTPPTPTGPLRELRYSATEI